MFSGFTKDTSDFLWELSFNNEREWFLAHKQQFEDVLNTPFKALADETFALMDELCPEKGLLLHKARIYRDARRLHGRGPYKDHLWFSIKGTNGLLCGPMFWFEIGAAEYSFGMGYYDTRPADMENFRKTISANPARFEALAAGIARCKEFKIYGEEYKKPKGESMGELIDAWYNRKRLGIECTRDFGEKLFDADLPQYLVSEYKKLAPMYDFFVEILNKE